MFGKAFENWIFHELSVHVRTLAIPYSMHYWRLSSGIEVDFVLGDAEIAIEVKGKSHLHSRDLRHLEEFRKEYPSVRKLVAVCLEPHRRITDKGVEVLPWSDFVAALWQGDIAPRT
jgi:predicted AAA+ superfamily ATPase